MDSRAVPAADLGAELPAARAGDGRLPAELVRGAVAVRDRPRVPHPPLQPRLPDPAPVRLYSLREAVPVPGLRDAAGAAGGHRRAQRRILPFVEQALRSRDSAGPDARRRCRCSSCTPTATAITPRARARCGSGRDARWWTRRPAAIAQFFGLSWPTGTASYDLGNRIVDIVPIPGHENAHVAIYDRRTGSCSPGTRSTRAGSTSARSRPTGTAWTGWWIHGHPARRPRARRAHRAVAHALRGLPGGTQYQPDEHALELGARTWSSSRPRSRPCRGPSSRRGCATSSSGPRRHLDPGLRRRLVPVAVSRTVAVKSIRPRAPAGTT